MILKSKPPKKYKQFNDYYFKENLKHRTNGILKFIGIDYKIKRLLSTELTNIGPKINRIDFAAEATDGENIISLIIECQTKLPTDDDIERFFQYVASLRVFKKKNVELYILCTKKAPYSKKEYMINENCIFTMHVISLKDIKAKDIFKNIENKLKNNIKITDDDIASLQLIIYTSYDEPRVKILNKTFNLIQKIADKTNMDINELSAITYLLDGLCANMLSEEEQKEYVGGSKMIFNPRERYHYNEGKDEGRKEGIKEGEKEGMKKVAKNLILEDMPIKKIMKVTGLTKEEILN